MEIIIFAIFLCIGFALIGFAHLTKDPLFVYIGAVMLLLCGLPLFTGSFERETGTIETYNLTLSENNITTGTIEETTQYEDKTDLYTRGLGLILVALSVYLSIIGWDIRNKNLNDKENSVSDKINL